MPLPTFLVIGANKASTTSLHNYLNQHPDIFMSPIKEPMFFVYDGKETPEDAPDRVTRKAYIVNNIKDYKLLFAEAGSQKERGESSTAYLSSSSIIADRIKSYVPNIKLICILRNPIERAYSGYRFHVGSGVEKRTFQAAMKNQLNPKTNDRKPQAYFHLGLYAEHIERYIHKFGSSKMKVYLYEDWCDSPQAVLRDIYQYLDIDPDFINNFSQKLNVSIKNDLGYIKWHRIAQLPWMRVLPETFRRLIRKSVTAVFNRSQLTPEIRNQLICFYHDDIKKLEGIINRDLSHWLE
jgi:hypothetical protein